MNRFFFVLLIATISFASTNVMAKKSVQQKKEIAVQLYSVRSLIGSYGHYQDGLNNVLKKLADMGYTSVEAAGYDDGSFYSLSPRKFREAVEKAGLKAISSHTTRGLSAEELESGDFSEAMKWWNKAIIAHKEAGMKYIVTPYIETPKTLKALKTYCDYFNQIGRLCRENGLSYGYHNHAGEFAKIEDNVIYDYMIQNTNPKDVFFQMDVYWAVIGKASPVDYFKKYPGRFRLLHIKDEREIGQSGMVGFDAIFNNACIAGVENIVVEVERYSYDVEKSINVSLDYLLKAPFVKASYSK